MRKLLKLATVFGMSLCLGVGCSYAVTDTATVYAAENYGTVVSTGEAGENATWTIYDSDGDSIGDKVVISGSGDIKTFPKNDREWKDVTTAIVEPGITSVGRYTFYYCSNLKSVELPNGLVSVENGAFTDCTSLTSITIPNSVTTIGDSVFTRCSEFTTVRLSSSLESIGDSCFYSCGKLENINFPASLTRIGEWAFCNCSSLVKVDLPESLISLGRSSFRACTSMQTVNVPSGITSVLNETFYNCDSLMTIKLSEGLTSIGNSAFASCDNLQTIVLPESLTVIESNAFKGCGKFETIVIPKNVTSIGNNAFYNCLKIANVKFISENCTIGTDAFRKSNILVMYGYGGSTAQAYATENDITFVLIKNGIVVEDDGTMAYYIDGVFQSEFTGFVESNSQVWYVENGIVSTDRCGLYKLNGVWYYINNGQRQEDYTGFMKNSKGTWYVKNGVVDLITTGNVECDGVTYYVEKSKGVTGLYKIDGVWNYIKEGKYQTEYTGMMKNGNGNWYVKNGVVDFATTGNVECDGITYYIEKSKGVTGLYKIDGVWNYIKDGEYQTEYTGMMKNNSGNWYVKNGVVDFATTGNVECDGITYYIEKSKGVTGLYRIDGVWNYIKEGEYQTEYTGMMKNGNGNWYVKNGVVDLVTTGNVKYKGVTYYVEKSKGVTGLYKIGNIWYYINAGAYQRDYTGVMENDKGNWYVQNGIVDLTFSGTVEIAGVTYTVKKGKIQ